MVWSNGWLGFGRLGGGRARTGFVRCSRVVWVQEVGEYAGGKNKHSDAHSKA